MGEPKIYSLDNIDLENDFFQLTNKNSNPFPVDVFPKIIQEVAYEAYNKFQFSLDYLGAGMLTAISSSIGNSLKVEVKNGWNEKANLFTVIVGRPGDSKSHALNFCFKPIHIKENQLFSEYSNSVRTRCLVLDIRNNAFLPWTFDSSLKVRDMFYYTANVTDNATSFEDYGAQPGSSQELPRMMYIVKDSGLLPDDTTMTNGTSAFTDDTWNIADMSAPVNVDLKTYSTSEEGVTFSSYIESIPNFYGDMHSCLKYNFHFCFFNIFIV